MSAVLLSVSLISASPPASFAPLELVGVLGAIAVLTLKKKTLKKKTLKILKKKNASLMARYM